MLTRKSFYGGFFLRERENRNFLHFPRWQKTRKQIVHDHFESFFEWNIFKSPMALKSLIKHDAKKCLQNRFMYFLFVCCCLNGTRILGSVWIFCVFPSECRRNICTIAQENAGAWLYIKKDYNQKMGNRHGILHTCLDCLEDIKREELYLLFPGQWIIPLIRSHNAKNVVWSKCLLSLW